MNLSDYPILLTKSDLEKIVRKVASNIKEDYQNSNNLVFLLVANGALHFGSDLLIHFSTLFGSNYRVDIIKVQSYCTNSNEQQDLKITALPTKDLIEGKDVIIIDDIYGTGKTLDFICTSVLDLAPNSLARCVLLSSRNDLITGPEYVGHYLDKKVFVFGYGLDLYGLHRSISEIRIAVEK